MTEQLSTAQHSTYSLSDNLKIFRYMVTARLRGSQGKYLWVPVYINNLSHSKPMWQPHPAANPKSSHEGNATPASGDHLLIWPPSWNWSRVRDRTEQEAGAMRGRA